MFPGFDQWNSLHEQLVDRWKVVRDTLPGNELYFSWSGAEQTGEDQITTTYMQETAAEAGFETVALEIEDVGWDTALERFVDLEEAPIAAMFKLYPWEWVLDDDVRPARGVEPAEDRVDRAAVEDAAVEQGDPGGPVGDVSRPPEPAARVPR